MNNTPVFKTGNLEFQEDLENELYDALRIDKNKVLKVSEIRDILINPTKDGLIKILSITSLSDFDRVRGQFQKLKSEGYRLTLDVAELIEKRTKELFNNKIKSDFQIEKVDTNEQNQKRVDELERQLEEMKVLLMQSLQANAAQDVEKSVSVDAEKAEVTNAVPAAKKSAGRPKKTTN
jgi:hypothetical protein